MDPEPYSLELLCMVCDQTLEAWVAPAQAEHLIETWARTHAHTPAERASARATTGEDTPWTGQG